MCSIVRGKVFSASWLEENFGDAHSKVKGSKIFDIRNGYPDTGNGRYMEKKSYAEWFAFNNIIRCHQNYLEFLPLTLISQLVAGLFRPQVAAAIALSAIVGRFLYLKGYGLGNNPNKRLLGVITSELAVFANIIIAGVGLYPMVKTQLFG